MSEASSVHARPQYYQGGDVSHETLSSGGELRWEVINEYHAKSKCGRYKVSIAKTTKGLTYTAWVETKKSGDKYPSFQPIAYAGTGREARAACEAHRGCK